MCIWRIQLYLQNKCLWFLYFINSLGLALIVIINFSTTIVINYQRTQHLMHSKYFLFYSTNIHLLLKYQTLFVALRQKKYFRIFTSTNQFLMCDLKIYHEIALLLVVAVSINMLLIFKIALHGISLNYFFLLRNKRVYSIFI